MCPFCHVLVLYLLCSCTAYQCCSWHISCMALLTSAQAGIKRSHVIRWCSVIPRPLVRSPLVFKPHQYLLDVILYWEASPQTITSSEHMVSLFKYLVDICMFHPKLAHFLHIYPSRVRIEIVQRCCHERKHFWYCRNVQCPVPGCSVLRNVRIMSTIYMYCNIRAALLLEYVRVLFLSISFIRSTSSARFYFLLEYLHLYINDFQWICIGWLSRLLMEIQIFRLTRLLTLYVAKGEPHHQCVLVKLHSLSLCAPQNWMQRYAT